MAIVKLKYRIRLKAKTIHCMSGNHPFPTMSTHLMMNVNIPPLRLVFQPEDCFFFSKHA